MESGAGGGKPKGGGGGKHVPRHQQMRPSRLSMNLIQTPSANPPPVPVKVVDDATFTAAAAAPSSTTGAPSPVGTSHVAVERLPATAAGKGKRGGKDNKGHRAGVRHSKQPHDARFPSSSSPSNRRHTLPAASSPSSSGTLVRVSSPLCTEVGVASVRSPKAAAAAAAVLSGVRGSKLVSTDNDGARGRGPSSELEELSLDYSGEKEEEDECIQAEAAEEAAAATTKPVAAAGGGAAGCAVGGGIFRPLSPLVLPVLRCVNMSERERTMNLKFSLLGSLPPTRVHSSAHTSLPICTPLSTGAPGCAVS